MGNGNSFARGNQRSATTRVYSAIYAGKSSAVSVSFNGQNQTVQNLREVRVAGSGSLTIKSDNDVIIVLYDMPDSKVGAVIIQDVIRRVAG